MDRVVHHVSVAEQAAQAAIEEDAAACVSTPDLPDSQAAYEKIPRLHLVGVLQAAADLEAFLPPWDAGTVIVARDRYERLHAAASACLERVPMRAEDEPANA